MRRRENFALWTSRLRKTPHRDGCRIEKGKKDESKQIDLARHPMPGNGSIYTIGMLRHIAIERG